MANYYIKRVAHSFMVLLMTITVSFGMFRLLPFGPYEMLEQKYTQQILEGGGEITPRMQERIDQRVQSVTAVDPDLPLWEQYIQYMNNVLFHQDLGTSIAHNQPVFELMLTRMQWSIFVSVYGLAIGITAALILGAVMAYNEGSRLDQFLTYFTVTNETIPGYVVAIILLIVLAYNLNWFPTGGLQDPYTTPGFNLPYMIGIVEHGTLMVASAVIAGFGGGLDFRGNCIRELGKDYIRVAHLRGLSDARIAIRYVGRNSILPIYTGLMLSFGAIISSSVILEWIFNYPAMGTLLLDATFNRDYPLMMGSLIIFTALTVTGLLIADLTYGIIDPRVQGGSERESF